MGELGLHHKGIDGKRTGARNSNGYISGPITTGVISGSCQEGKKGKEKKNTTAALGPVWLSKIRFVAQGMVQVKKKRRA